MSTSALLGPDWRRRALVALVCGFSVSAVWFLLTWRYGFDLSDEGFYWYGVQRVLNGEVPLRDFMAYDIGRYYWAGAFAWALGADGLFAVRLAAAAFQAVGVAIGVFLCLLASRKGALFEWFVAIAVACVLVLWVRPYYKSFDHATSALVVAMLFVLLKSVMPTAWLGAGVCLGFAAVMGRNHGLYGAVAAIFIVTFLLVRTNSPRSVLGLCGWFLAGVFLGFLPNLLMAGLVDGFAVAFVESVLSVFKTGANVPLPLPWPWKIETEDVGVLLKVSEHMVGVGFLALFLLPVAGACYLSFRRFEIKDDATRVLFASIAAAIPYIHYAVSRADLTHLTLAIYPSLIGLMAVIAAGGVLRAGVFGGALMVSSVLTFVNENAFLSQHLIRPTLVDTVVDGERMWVAKGTYYRLQSVSTALKVVLGPETRFLAIPNMPGIHAIFRMKMPIWEIYPLFRRDQPFELREIARMEEEPPALLLLSDHALDGVEDMRFSKMHPLTYDWFNEHYYVSDHIALAKIDVFVRKTPPLTPAESPRF